MVSSNHIIETDNELIFERSEELFATPSRATNQKQVIASYLPDETLNLPIRRASDRELVSMTEDEQLANPVKVDIAQTVVNSAQKYSFIQ